MNFVCIGSCRLTCMKANNIATDFLGVNLTHSTKDAIQLLKWAMGKINIPDDINSYVFHSGMWSASPKRLHDHLIKLIHNMDGLIIEICSYKSYKVENYYCHTDILNCSPDYPLFKHIPPHIYQNVRMITDDKKELENDIEEILELIGNKKLIIVTHILDSKDANMIPERERLIADILEISSRKNIPVICPGEILITHSREEIVPDYNHYSEIGLDILEKFYREKMESIINNFHLKNIN